MVRKKILQTLKCYNQETTEKKKKIDYILEIHSFLYYLKKKKNKNRLLIQLRTLYFPDTSFSPNTDAYGVSQITIKHSVKQPQHSQKCVCVCVYAQIYFKKHTIKNIQ